MADIVVDNVDSSPYSYYAKKLEDERKCRRTSDRQRLLVNLRHAIAVAAAEDDEDMLETLIEYHPIFSNNSRFPQTSTRIQLGVALSRLGTNGTGSSIIQHEVHFGFSAGAVTDFTHRVITALLDQSDE
ncbi:hypothetical protein EC991_005446 [Linnemannia zychae]|nr:hypothetical protein EC991_005446 [Linnemannia zychae]